MAVIPSESFQFTRYNEYRIYLSGGGIQYAGKFTPPYNMVVSGIETWLQDEVGTSPTYLFGIKQYLYGTSAFLGSAAQAYTSIGWKPLYFVGGPLSLLSGTTYYHYVNHSTGTIGATRYITTLPGSPLNSGFPNVTDFTTYTDTNTLAYQRLDSGLTWTEFTPSQHPNYKLIFTNGSRYGVPFRTDLYNVFGSQYIGQNIQPSSNLTISGIGFVLDKSAAALTPKDNCWVELRSGTTPFNIMGSWLLAGSQQLTAGVPRWFDTYFENKNLTSGVNYIINLKSVGTNSGSPFRVWGCIQLDSGSIAGFKDIRSYNINSITSGVSWINALSSDMNFRFYDGGISGQSFSQWLNETFTTGDSKRFYGSYWRPETFTFADTKRFAYSGWKSETLATVDSKKFDYSMWKPETLTTADSKKFDGSVWKSETLTTGDNRRFAYSMWKNDALALADSQWKAFSSWKAETLALAESITKAGSYWKSEALVFADTKSFVDSILKSESLTIADSVDALIVYFVYKTLNETLQLTDYLIKAGNVTKTESVAFSDSTRKAGSYWKSETLTIAESFTYVKAIMVNLVETIQTVESLVKLGNYWKSENLSLSDSKLFSMSIPKSEVITLSDAQWKAFSTWKNETVSLSDSIRKYMGIAKTDSLAISDSTIKDMGKRIADNLVLVESSVKSFSKTATETLSLQDVSAKIITILKSESISASDYIILQRVLNLVETLQVMDSLGTSWIGGIILSENLTLSDAYRRIVNLGNLLVNDFLNIISDDIADTFNVGSTIIHDDISNKFGSNFA